MAGYDGDQLDAKSLEIYAKFLGEFEIVETGNKIIDALQSLGVQLLQVCVQFAWSNFKVKAKRKGFLLSLSIGMR